MPELTPFSLHGSVSSSCRRLLAVACALSAGLMAAGAATAQTFPLTLELQTGQVDDFGVVHVAADIDGALVFDVEIDPDRVGVDASLRRLFFNLLPEPSALDIESLDDEQPHRLVVRESNRKLARSGARFDWRVDFVPPKRKGSAGRAQADAFRRVRFRILADSPLVVEDLLPLSVTRDGEPLQMVVDLKRGRTPDGGDRVRWVGGVYEAPSEPPILN